MAIQKLSVQDEVLGGEIKFRIIDENENIIFDNCTIEMITEILTKGTDLNKLLFDKIDSNFEAIKPLVVTGSVSKTSNSQSITLGFKPDLVIVYSNTNNGLDVTATTSSSNRYIPLVLTQAHLGSSHYITDEGFVVEFKEWASSVSAVYYIAIKFIGGE